MRAEPKAIPMAAGNGASDVSPDHWRRVLWAMISIQFVVGGTFSIVPPVIPLILPALTVPPAAVPIWSGVLVGITPLAAALMSPQWGRLADRLDRRIIIVITCVAASVSTTCMSFATSPWQLLTLRFAMGLFGGHIAAALSIVSAAAPESRLGWALGCLATGQLAGTLLGPLIGGAIADAFSSLRAPFVMAGGASLLIAGVVALIPNRSSRPDRAAQVQKSGLPGKLWQQPQVRSFIVALLLAQVAIMIAQPVISLRVREFDGMRADIATRAGLAFSVVALSGLLAAPWVGRLSDRFGSRRVLFVVAMLAILFVAPQAYAASYRWFVIERFLAGLFLCSILPLANGLIGKTVDPSARGQAFGLAAGAAFLGAFIGPLSGGLIGARFGLSSVFLVSTVFLVVNAAWIGAYIWPRLRVAQSIN